MANPSNTCIHLLYLQLRDRFKQLFCVRFYTQIRAQIMFCSVALKPEMVIYFTKIARLRPPNFLWDF